MLVAAAALSLVSCGGAGDGVVKAIQRDDEQITKARLIERADAICKRDEARASAALTQLPRPARSASIEAILLPVLEIREEAIRAGAARIAELGTPASDAAALDRYLEERAAAAASLRAAIRATKRRNRPEINAALRSFHRNKADKAGKRFGFKVCALGAGRARR